MSFSSQTTTESTHDVVRVIASGWSTVYTNSGSSWPEVVFYSGGNALYFTFNTDGSAVYYGFDAYVSCSLSTTQYSSYAMVTTRDKPYVDNFFAHSNLVKFDGATGYRIEFDSQSATESCCDKIKIYEGNTVKGSGTPLATYSGTLQGSSTTVFTAHGIYFEFTTDGSATDNGFTIYVYPQYPPTPNPSAAPTAQPTIQRYIIKNPTGDYSCPINENIGTFAFGECYRV